MNDGATVVHIEVTREDGVEVSGTGFLIDERGRVATCLHVVERAAKVLVQVPPFRYPWRYEAAPLKCSLDSDLAILDPEAKSAATTASAALHPDWKKDLEIGDKVEAWGYSAHANFESGPQLFPCSVSSFSEQAGMIGITGAINPGDSGGPVFDVRHRVIGIVNAKDGTREGQAMVTPVSLLRRLAAGVVDDDVLDARAVHVAGDLPMADRGYPVIGREAVSAKLKEHLTAGNHQVLVVLPGVGKTTLAADVVRDPEICRHFEEGILWANIGKKPNVEAQLRGWVSALQISLAAIKDSSDQVKALKAEVKRAIGMRRMLLVLDDVWDEATAREFRALGDECVYLYTTRDKKLASILLGGGGRKWMPVDPLPPEAGLRLLREIAPDAVAQDEAAARRLVDAVSGLPLALVLIGRALSNAYEDGDAEQLAYTFNQLGKASARLNLLVDDAQSLWSIIDVSYAALASDELRRAFRTLSIFRPDPHAFTAEMAERICGVDRGAFQALRNLGLIEFRKAGEAGHEDGYTMHRVIAEYGRDQLATLSSLEIPRLHGEAVRFYAAKMGEDIEHDPNAYLSKYKFEDRDWQRLKEAWLYHLAQTGDYVVALRAFLRVWFDAFWWWGYYQRFPFCGRLVSEWRSREIDEQARKGLENISAFEECYPEGYDKRRGGDWAGVDRALVAIRQRMKLDGPLRTLPDEDARLVRAFTDFFLAESCGYGQGNRQAALDYYRSAHDLFRACGAAWEANWAQFYVAQYGLDERDVDLARSSARQSLDAALAVETLADVDPELLANNYRLLGEVEAGADREAALDAWRRASFYAYAFQAYPQDADSYTLAFYREIVERIAASLIALHTDDPDAATTAALALKDFWSMPSAGADLDDAFASHDACAVAAAIFPRVADDAAVSTDKRRRADEVARAVERVHAALPDAKLPPRESDG